MCIRDSTGIGQKKFIQSFDPQGAYQNKYLNAKGDGFEFESNQLKHLEKRKELVAYYESNNIGTVNFKGCNTVPNILSITLLQQEAEEYLMLQHKKIVASTGSACNAEILTPSHVLSAIKIEGIKNIVRISF